MKGGYKGDMKGGYKGDKGGGGKKGGGKKGGYKGPDLQEMERHFSMLGDCLWEKLSDLSVSGGELQPYWDEIMHTRAEIARFHGVEWVANADAFAWGMSKGGMPMDGGYKGGGDYKGGAHKGGGPKGGALMDMAKANGGDGDVLEDWKSKLGGAYSKENHQPASKEIITYVVEPTAEGGGRIGGFQAHVSCAWSGQLYPGEEKTSKRQAEHSAAKVALQAEFPQYFAAAMASFAMGTGGGKQPNLLTGGGTKRKHDVMEGGGKGGPPQGQDAKSVFFNKMAIVKGEMGLGPIETGDLIFAPHVNELNMNVCKVIIAFLPETEFTGEPNENKKTAEKNCCEVALQGLKAIIDEHEAVHMQKKNIKKIESLDKLKAQKASRKGKGKGNDAGANFVEPSFHS